ncbi:MAG: response regulator [Pseudomonadales bacterium]|nr:response regulator [Pseudomonadales bacterium]
MTAKKSSKILNILLIDDDPDDQYLLSEAIEESGTNISLSCLTDEHSITGFITQKYSALPAGSGIDLILLDLNMPGINGFEVIDCIKQNDELKQIPVIVYTTSHATHDVEKAYGKGATAFITKQGSFDETAQIVADLYNYWKNIVTLPTTWLQK